MSPRPMPVPEHAGLLSRRTLLALGGGALVVSLVPGALRRRRSLVTRTIPVMGTLAEVLVVHDDRGEAEAAIDLAFERLRWVDATMSRFRHDSDVGRVNLGASRDAVTVHPATAVVIGEALHWAELSEGAYDPGVARLVEAWDVGHRTTPPARSDFERLAGRRFHRGIGLDRWQGKSVVRFDSPDIGLDLGGIAKGYAVDAAIAALEGVGIRDAVVNAGGDLRAIGRSADGDWWRVGVRDPAAPDRISWEVEVVNQAIATSGDYLQGFDYAGRRYHHIFDPATGEPRQVSVHSNTVLAPTCLAADGGATAVFGLPAEQAKSLLGWSGSQIVVPT